MRGRADPYGNGVVICGVDVCRGKQEVEAGARAGATHLPVLLAGGEDGCAPGGLGRQVAWPGGVLLQVSQ